jgi:hypothetical protein
VPFGISPLLECQLSVSLTQYQRGLIMALIALLLAAVVYTDAGSAAEPVLLTQTAQDCRPNADRRRRNERLGAALGAFGGALLGDRLGMGSGQARSLGASLGTGLAGFLDACDQAQASNAATEALSGPGGRQVAWTSQTNSGVGGSAMVTRQRQTPDGQTCRVVAEIAYRGGEEIEEEVEYCQTDGAWVRSA